jgi:hypothetical protein
MKYCAKTNYYNEQIAPKVNITDLDKDVLASGDIYLSKTKDSRNFIETILAKYKGDVNADEYDLVNHPIITTDENDWKGLPVAQVQGIKDLVADTLHTNQKLALVVSGVDDNVIDTDEYSLTLKMG